MSASGLGRAAQNSWISLRQVMSESDDGTTTPRGPLVSSEAVEVIRQLVMSAVAEPTQAITARLEKLEERLATSDTLQAAHTGDNTTGMSISGAGGSSAGGGGGGGQARQ